MKYAFAVLVVFATALESGTLEAGDEQPDILRWEELAEFPNRLGVAGAYAGVSNGVLIVGGGANFPVEPLFTGGKHNPRAQKVWCSDVYVLTNHEGQWQKAASLPRRLAYGGSVTTDGGVICIGGGDGKQHFAEVFRLTWARGKLLRRPLPSLPKPCAYCGAALLGTTIYVAGGQQAPHGSEAMNNLWALDLSQDDLCWKKLKPWPGPGRILPVVGVQDGSFFVVSGCELRIDTNGRVKRRYLTDGYRFTPGPVGASGRWKAIADVPVPIAGAPSPAIPTGQNHLLVLGGDHGRYAERTLELADKHPGFSHDVLAYNTITDTWKKAGTVPAGPVTTPAVTWRQEQIGRDAIIIPSGETRPGVRSAKIWMGTRRDMRSNISSGP